MFEDINKSKLAFEKYVELKRKTLIKSYTERFKWVDQFLYWFSWFGNAVSIFLAFFFMQNLFLSSFNEVGNSIFVPIGIVIFLTMFELLKRYVFGIFSVEVIKTKFQIFKSNLLSFLVGVFIILSLSFYLSLNGAYVFIDNTKTFKVQTETNIVSKVDSINTFYLNQYIKPLMDDNKILNEQNSKLPTWDSKGRSENNLKIKQNNDKISNYEVRRDKEVDEFKIKQTSKLSESIDQNKYNLISFILISALIEIIIMIGIYYDKYYKHKMVLEYEETVINTPEFKKWYKYNYILEIIYNKSKNVGDQVPSVNNIIELSESGGVKITKPELDKIFKILYYLEIVKLEGNRRYINVSEEDGKKSLRTYFNIV